MNFAHSGSPKSILEWFLLAEQIIICHYDQKRLVLFEQEKKNKKKKQPHILFIVNKL